MQAIFMALMLAAQSSWAPSGNGQYGGFVNPYPAPIIVQPGPSNVEVYHHDSTIGGNHLRALSLYNRSIGEMNYWNSLAACNYQQAEAQFQENRARHLAMCAARREQEHRQSEAHVRRQKLEQAARGRRDFEAAQTLGRDLDRSGGRIDWPAALEQSEYAAQVDLIDKRMARWVTGGHLLGQDERLLVRRGIKQIEAALQHNLGSLSAEELSDARGLLRKLLILIDDRQPAAELLAGEEPRRR